LLLLPAIETTLWSTEWGIAEMVNKPEIQKKLRDELDAKLGKGVPITEPDVANLPYLQVCKGSAGFPGATIVQENGLFVIGSISLCLACLVLSVKENYWYKRKMRKERNVAINYRR
jgi:hypothetical protein